VDDFGGFGGSGGVGEFLGGGGRSVELRAVDGEQLGNMAAVAMVTSR